ncbi:nucleocapsid protein [Orthobunyavirus teteense]|uniref:Nucleoprotein n=1 Tax=Orthobunyavirus teteense TaxID=3052448 RepID=A0A0D4CZH2_9VIRU|nr:nucleocapsid protein [Orthobunyavirus teteense]AJT55737.1 nucleoprotein [Orthobunyavirus teteense]AKO90195.1 nucleocapsid protein [Orthobunyavirus teteense]
MPKGGKSDPEPSINVVASAAFEDDEIDYHFTAGDDGGAPFNPMTAYKRFMEVHGKELNLPNIKVFFLKARQAKEIMRSKAKSEMTFTFGSLTLTFKNTHHPSNRHLAVEQDDLTINRVTGFMAHAILLTHRDPKHKDAVEKTIINPIAESKGVTWKEGANVYLSFFPGTEMFMLEFKFFPLAVGLARCHKEKMDTEYLKKPMRQMLTDGTKAQVWLGAKIEEIRKAYKVCMNLKFVKAGFSEAAREFLKEFGLDQDKN